jgi:hypothetical protein
MMIKVKRPDRNKNLEDLILPVFWGRTTQWNRHRVAQAHKTRTPKLDTIPKVGCLLARVIGSLV